LESENKLNGNNTTRFRLRSSALETRRIKMSDRSTIKPPLRALGRAAYRAVLPIVRTFGIFHAQDGRYATERIASLQRKLEDGETAYIVGIGAGGHNTGVGLVEVSKQRGIRLVANHEEERFRAIKHYQKFPSQSVEALVRQMRELNIEPSKIHAVCANWDYASWVAMAVQSLIEELPGSLRLLRKNASPHMNLDCILEASTAPRELGKVLSPDGRPIPIICQRHHDNHASFSWGCSPFSASSETVLVVVIDGAGDEGAVSSYIAEKGQLRLFRQNDNIWDSLGLMYGMLSSSQGGWPLLSSEGRYMGAAAWGNLDRLTNPYYMQLRDIFVFERDGQVFLNRALANWQRGGCLRPYTKRLSEILGPPLLPHQMWNPDAVLSVEEIAHASITRERVDKAAAVQLVFEDGLFHIIGHLIRTTKSTQLVLTGGTALNCIANMLLMEHFNTKWYEQNLGMKDATLHLWIPPVPGDMGTPIGAAYHFACRAGVKPGHQLEHAFYGGVAATRSEIEDSLDRSSETESKSLGNIQDRATLKEVADLMAYIVSHDGIIGLYQGCAETGPRALGHRSILANPANAKTREVLNQRVKFRELIRPLAPMATLKAAKHWFHLADGAADGDYNAYNYMVLTARAKPEAYEKIPAVIHKDGTCRLQIVREKADPLTYAYLEAMGHRIGTEVSVNTSLNVGAPIAQTPSQAIDTLHRSAGMQGLVMVGAEGDTFLVWHNVDSRFKDSGRSLLRWVSEWEGEMAPRTESRAVAT
jgi:carbamoyltransferase